MHAAALFEVLGTDLAFFNNALVLIADGPHPNVLSTFCCSQRSTQYLFF